MGLFSFLGSILESLYGDDKEKSEEQLQEEKEERDQEEQNKWYSRELYYGLSGLSHPDGGSLTIDEVDVSVWDYNKTASAYVSVTIRIDIPYEIQDDSDAVRDFKNHTEYDYTHSYGVNKMEEDVKFSLESLLSSQKKGDYEVSASVSISFDFYSW